MENWSEQHRDLTRRLSQFGWFAPTYMIGKDYQKIVRTIDRIDVDSPSTDEQRREAEKFLYLSMMDVVFHPNFRARLVWHGMKVPHFKEYAHIVEMGVFAFYKRDYAGSILLMLTAFEGILRSHLKVEGSNFKQLTNRLSQAPLCQRSEELKTTHSAYRDALVEFLKNWLYRSTKDPSLDFSLSVLNRHYVIHGSEPGNFYRPQDAHRMMLAMDLLLDYLSHATEVWAGVFLPESGTDKDFAERREYYEALSEGDVTFKQMQSRERHLLKKHMNYVAPDVPEPDFMTHRLMGMLDQMSILQKAQAIRE